MTNKELEALLKTKETEEDKEYWGRLVEPTDDIDWTQHEAYIEYERVEKLEEKGETKMTQSLAIHLGYCFRYFKRWNIKKAINLGNNSFHLFGKDWEALIDADEKAPSIYIYNQDGDITQYCSTWSQLW